MEALFALNDHSRNIFELLFVITISTIIVSLH